MVQTWSTIEKYNTDDLYQVIEFDLLNFAVPNETSYDFVLTVNVESADAFGFISVTRENLGTYVQFTPDAF